MNRRSRDPLDVESLAALPAGELMLRFLESHELGLRLTQALAHKAAESSKPDAMRPRPLTSAERAARER